MSNRHELFVVLVAVILMMLASSGSGAEPLEARRADHMLAEYFRGETRKLADVCLADVKSWNDWTSRRELYRQQLREMLGLDSLPERTPLQPVVTGIVEHGDFNVEKLQFQSSPHLYVTANLFVPKQVKGPVPAVLYLCGHSPAKIDDVSYGNKTEYQHHGVWFARNGYVCLVMDTLQLGEIEGLHHGTYRENMWWWNAAGYTPAGVETWNAIRALDYLQSRPEVDGERLGVTGRSGGGASSWWIAALDDRIKAAVPVAGITNLEDHVVHGCVEGHCDCMYVVNTHRWDYAQVAALVAPRPLLLANTDHDEIFPLDGVMDLYQQLRRLYDLAGEPGKLGLHIAAGPHEDTQVLQLHAFQWFNHFLKKDNGAIDVLAPTIFEPAQLKVFDTLPRDEINTRVHETFTRPAPTPTVPPNHAEWAAQRSQWLVQLRKKCFGGWPDGDADGDSPRLRKAFEMRSAEARVTAYDFESQEGVTLRLYVLAPSNAPSKLDAVRLHPLDNAGWSEFLTTMRSRFGEDFEEDLTLRDRSSEPPQQLVLEDGAVAYFAPRGIGPTAWEALAPEKHTHIRRRFMLLGQTLDGMRVWDTRRAIQALRRVEDLTDASISLDADREMSGLALYAALFEPKIAGLRLSQLPKSHREGPDFLNVLRILDVPQAVAMAAENSQVRIEQSGASAWSYPLAVADRLGWKERIEIVDVSTRGQ